MTDAERVREIETCLSKKKHSQHGAEHAALVASDRSGIPMRHYRCLVCQDWHITSSPVATYGKSMPVSDQGTMDLLNQAVQVSGLAEADIFALIEQEAPDWTDAQEWPDLSPARRLGLLIAACMAEDGSSMPAETKEAADAFDWSVREKIISLIGRSIPKRYGGKNVTFVAHERSFVVQWGGYSVSFTTKSN